MGSGKVRHQRNKKLARHKNFIRLIQKKGDLKKWAVHSSANRLLSFAWPDPLPRRAFIACSISARAPQDLVEVTDLTSSKATSFVGDNLF